MISLIGCASEPFVTDEESAAALQADRQNTEFQEKGVPSRPIDKNNWWLFIHNKQFFAVIPLNRRSR